MQETAQETQDVSFSQLDLQPQLMARLSDINYLKPTPIQIKAIPEVLSGKDLLAGAQTGTGKTAAFALPIISRLLEVGELTIAEQPDDVNANNATITAIETNAPKALVLAPTRELAVQVQQAFEQFTLNLDVNGHSLKTVVVYGGVSSDKQKQQLAGGVDIVVATPGRLLDLNRQRLVDLRKVQTLVLDEADRMLDMGFRDEIIEVLKRLPKQRQTLLFSATLDDRIHKFSRRLVQSPKVVEVASRNQTAAKITERVFNVDAAKKQHLLNKLLKVNDWSQVLVFNRKKQDVDATVSFLNQLGTSAAAFHADLSQAKREHVLAEFKAGEVRVLVATDVAARGLDIEQLPAVINMELPFQSADYVHRIGRTGRAGQAGEAITLLSVDDEPLLIKLEALLDRRLPQQWYPGFEPDLTQVAPVTRKTKKGSLKQQARKAALARSAKKR
ncbi:DEAD/DEAH box helicase [Shewanella maritima]|uniref:DEAD/DEAH box helicase n=1 Tax=Shewanella maritima TaxID=2520507 RepID=A0A411PMY2_9GAMM|nr:DEAD/DEAH box helicase [Shewanella maritima]QBF84907.1 DEAD/DEAH box helicase [Shewanella maritima]